MVPATLALGGFCWNREFVVLLHFRGQVKCGWGFYVQDSDVLWCICSPLTLLVSVVPISKPKLIA